ncbi:type VII secretion-associated protein [Mycobacterium sp. 1274761.0]|nr:type VII secretion-associated protein [Mycobacterium sp. 1274761.0]
MVSAALDCLDDDIALLDEQPVAVTAIWREVFRAVVPEQVDAVVLVCPTWWPPMWVERVEVAASGRSADVSVLLRADVLARDVPGVPTITEIAADLVAISRAGSVVGVCPREGPTADLVSAAVDSIGSAATVLIDAPIGVAGADRLADAVGTRLLTNGVAVTTVSPDRLLAERCAGRAVPSSRGRRQPRRVMLAAAAASVALLCCGVGLASETSQSAEATLPMTLLVEGRVALMVPALWTVQRITSGPGSARVAVTGPDKAAAVLLTQSQVPGGESLAETAAALRGALDEQRPGVFGDFVADGRRADRSVATYRETRPDRQVDWAVFVDGIVRIGIGCQSAPGGEHVVSYACDEAIRSAHAVV